MANLNDSDSRYREVCEAAEVSCAKGASDGVLLRALLACERAFALSAPLESHRVHQSLTAQVLLRMDRCAVSEAPWLQCGDCNGMGCGECCYGRVLP